MRFMMIVKHAEDLGYPPKELMEAIGALAEEAAKSGTMVASGGLLPTAQGALVKLQAGKVTATDGPFTESKEIIGGFAIFELSSLKEARESAVQFMELHRKHWPGWQGATEVRPMYAPGEMPKHK